MGMGRAETHPAARLARPAAPPAERLCSRPGPAPAPISCRPQLFDRVPLGRQDTPAAVDDVFLLPFPTFDATQLLCSFLTKGFSIQVGC